MADYRLDLREERLWCGNQLIHISNKAFCLLRLFVINQSKLLTKETILDEIWPHIYVSEGLIKEYVHDLRVALGDNPKEPHFIETVRGRGYRFLGGIEVVGLDATDVAPTESRSVPPTVLVIPFTDLTDDKRWSLFCSGLNDDLVIDLARYPDLHVIAGANASGNWGEIKELHETAIKFILSGSVQISDSNVRINVKLIDTIQGNHIWTEQYEREFGEFFVIQRDIVGHVVSALAGLSGQIPQAERKRIDRRKPDDLKAYELYLLGIEHELPFDKQSALRGVEIIQRAIELDPDFARAQLVLAWLCWQIVLGDWVEDLTEYRELAEKSFIRAASLDPLDPFAVMELAAVRATNGDITGARDALERALDLGRNDAELLIVTSNYVATLIGDQTRAEKLLGRGLKMVAHKSPYHHLSATRVSYFTKDFEFAISSAKRSPDCLITRLFELLAMAQLERGTKLGRMRDTFIERFPKFNPESFLRSLPITATGAKHLFLDGVQKAGLHWRPPDFQVSSGVSD